MCFWFRQDAENVADNKNVHHLHARAGKNSPPLEIDETRDCLAGKSKVQVNNDPW